jgi:hypothetical protein
VLEPITKLKYTDLVYLLNILKLQAAKKSEKLMQTKEEWTSDFELALSIVQSSSNLLNNDKQTKGLLTRKQAQVLFNLIADSSV